MAFLFYVLGWLAILGGAAWGGYLLYYNMNAANVPMQIEPVMRYMNTIGFSFIGPGLTAIFTGLLLLAIGGVLSRLDEIAYNTRSMT